MPRVFGVLLFAVLSTPCLGGSIVYLRVHRDVIEQRLATPPQSAAERIHRLRADFEAAGCAGGNLREEAIPKQGFPNLICTLPGTEPGSIVIGAPIEVVAKGPEHETQWATLALLPLLAESLSHVLHRRTLVFVAFCEQQHGLHGSSKYLKQLATEQPQGIRAMVGLEDIGRTPVVYALAQQDPELAKWLALSSNTLQMHSIPVEIPARSVDAQLMNGQGESASDEYLVEAKAFQRAHIPAIAVRSDPMSIIPAKRRTGSWPGDTSVKSFDLDTYERTYNLLSVYILYLDGNLGAPQATPPMSPTSETAADSSVASPASPKDAQANDAQNNDAVLSSGNSTSGAESSAAAVSVPPSFAAQAPQGPPPDLPVFRAQTELVVMDVSVTDARGIPLKGLHASDFTLMENGKPQAIKIFESHGSQAGGPVAAENPLPTGTFTNRLAAAPDAPLSIFLFDLLNTPPQDQAYSRAQMLQFLRGMPRGKHLAVFVLGTHLEIVQGFTDDAEGLVKTAEKVMRQTSPMLTTQAQQQQDRGFSEEAKRYAMPSVIPNAPGAQAAAIVASIKQAENVFESERAAADATMEGVQENQRIMMTLDSLETIARTVSAYPGRKNLVWLSGSFEIRLRPSSNNYLNVLNRTTQAGAPVSDLNNNTPYDDAIRAVTTVLAKSRIAVYPIDVRGLQTGGVDISVGTDQSRHMVDPEDPNAFNQLLSEQSTLRSDEQNSMIDLAEQTGGHVFLNNDVLGSIGRSLDEGSNYYTLAYTPEKNENDKNFRRVEIELNRGSVKLAYRPGYYPTAPHDSVKQSGAHMLAVAMQPGLPQSTMLLLTARVLLPDATSKAVRIDYRIDLGRVNFTDTADNQKRALLDCMAVALDEKGNIAGQVANTMDATLPPQEFQALLRTGLTMHQELVLMPGTYDLRVGVLDRASQRIGTINIPLVVSEETKTN